MSKEYIPLNKLDIYILARKLSSIAWSIYDVMDWRIKKIMGDQFIESTDSVGANIAEGYGRYHFLDRIKFYYNARASLSETRHWYELLLERKIINNDEGEFLKQCSNLHIALNQFINSNYKSKDGS